MLGRLGWKRYGWRGRLEDNDAFLADARVSFHRLQGSLQLVILGLLTRLVFLERFINRQLLAGINRSGLLLRDLVFQVTDIKGEDVLLIFQLRLAFPFINFQIVRLNRYLLVDYNHVRMFGL